MQGRRKARSSANARGVEIVADEFVDRGVTDLTPQLTKIKRGSAATALGFVGDEVASALALWRVAHHGQAERVGRVPTVPLLRKCWAGL